jgi:hypothetical protein
VAEDFVLLRHAHAKQLVMQPAAGEVCLCNVNDIDTMSVTLTVDAGCAQVWPHQGSKVSYPQEVRQRQWRHL